MKVKKLTILTLLSASSILVAASCGAAASSSPAPTPTPNPGTGNKSGEDKNKSSSGSSNDKSKTGGNNNQTKPVVSATAVTKSDKFISLNSKVNYVALGDSITAGFDGALAQDYPGSLENGKVKGSSYPAFLADILNTQNRLNSFNNFAVSGSTLLQWIKYLGGSYSAATDVSLNGFNESSEAKSKVLAELRKANLVTLTLGANDLFQLMASTDTDFFNLDKLKAALTEAKYDVREVFKTLFRDLIREIKTRFRTFLTKLRELAPNANINIVSYPLPLLRLKESFDKYLTNLFKLALKATGKDVSVVNSPLDSFINSINSALQDLANTSSNTFFVNVFNSSYWGSNASNLATVFLDIHPNYKGYKKMAMDLYLKLTKKNKKYDTSLNKYDFNDSYWKSDESSLRYQLEVDKSNESLLQSSSTQFVNTDTDFLREIKSQFDAQNFKNRIANYSFLLKFLLKGSALVFLETETYQKLDKTGLIKKLLLKRSTGSDGRTNSNLDKLIDVIWSLNSRFTSLAGLQEELQRRLTSNGDLSIDSITQYLKDKIFTVRNLTALLTELVPRLNEEDGLAVADIFKGALKSVFTNLRNRLTNRGSSSSGSSEESNVEDLIGDTEQDTQDESQTQESGDQEEADGEGTESDSTDSTQDRSSLLNSLKGLTSRLKRNKTSSQS